MRRVGLGKGGTDARQRLLVPGVGQQLVDEVVAEAQERTLLADEPLSRAPSRRHREVNGHKA